MSLLEMQSWGPSGWKFVHAVSFAYPVKAQPDQREAAYKFLTSLGLLLPCKVCCRHFGQYISKRVPSVEAAALKGRDSLSRLLVDAHNEVNVRLGKPVVPYETVYQMYMGTGPRPKPWGIICACVVLVLLAACIFVERRPRHESKRQTVTDLLGFCSKR